MDETQTFCRSRQRFDVCSERKDEIGQAIPVEVCGDDAQPAVELGHARAGGHVFERPVPPVAEKTVLIAREVRGTLHVAEVPIAAIEAHYFDKTKGEEPDLRRIAESWLTRAS